MRGAKMEIIDLTDEDAETIERVRKTLRISKRMAWSYLALFVVQFALLIWFASFLTGFFRDGFGDVSPRDIGIGLCLGFVFGSMMAAWAFAAARHFGTFVDGMWGNKQNKLLIKCFEIATGQKGARNLITTRPGNP